MFNNLKKFALISKQAYYFMCSISQREDNKMNELKSDSNVIDFTKIIKRIKSSCECISCNEIRVLQKAHIIAKRLGGHAVMALCPTCHFCYDNYLLRTNEVELIRVYLEKRFNKKFADKIIADYYYNKYRKQSNRGIQYHLDLNIA